MHSVVSAGVKKGFRVILQELSTAVCTAIRDTSAPAIPVATNSSSVFAAAVPDGLNALCSRWPLPVRRVAAKRGHSGVDVLDVSLRLRANSRG